MSIRFATRLVTTALIGGTVVVALTARAGSEDGVARIVAQHVRAVLGTVGGVAVAIRTNGRTRFFNFGMADRRRPITSDVLFNLGSVGKTFDTALLALADQEGALSLDDPVAKHIPAWKNLAERVRVAHIPGEHNTCVSRHVGDLAERLNLMLAA